MLIYNSVDSEQPEFFRYVTRELAAIKKGTISKDELRKIFMTPKVDFSLLNEEGIADVLLRLVQVFYILDTGRQGSISADEFFKLYSQTENFLKLSPDKQSEVRDSIKENFRKLTFDGSMTPL